MSQPAEQPNPDIGSDSSEPPTIRLSDGRTIVDRRAAATKPISRYSIFGRRRHNVGSPESRNYYVDWVDGHFRTLIVSIAAFIMIDTFCTLYIVSQGGSEANPVMDWVLQKGMGWFIGTKVTAAILGVFLLAIHRHFLLAKVSGGIIVVAYGMVVFYHLHLLLKIWVG